MYWLFHCLRPLIARGFLPEIPPRDPAWIYPLPLPPEVRGDSPLVIVFCPTFVTAGNRRDQLTAIDGILDQIRPFRSAGPARAFLFLVGIQHDASQAAEAEDRLHVVAGHCRDAGVDFAGFTLELRGKTLSLNVALQAARVLSATAIVQIDDDVYLEEECVEQLLREYEAHGREAVVGATKIGIARPSKTSRLLRWLRRQTGHSTDYPHGCCIAFNPRLLPPAIPHRFVSDDGFLCFSFLRPAAANPMALLRLTPSARCRYFVGGTPWQSMKRIRRMLLNAHLLMAGFPPETSRYYFRYLLFKGMWPIGRGGERFGPAAVGRWLLRFLYFWIFVAIGVELALRGFLRRPLRSITWAGVRHRTVPRPAAALDASRASAPEARSARMPDRPFPERRTWAQRLLERGLVPPDQETGRVEVLFGDVEKTCSGRVDEIEMPPELAAKWRGRFGVWCPSVASRMPAEDYLARIDAYLTELARAVAGDDRLPVVFVAGVQCGEHNRDDAVARIAGVRALARARGIDCVAFAQSATGKLRAINAAVRLTQPCAFTAWLWLDDDVSVKAEAMRTLLTRFVERPWLGAIGANCRPRLPRSGAPRLVYGAKRITQSSRLPMAGCMVVAAEVVASGIPPPYTVDDGYVLARLIAVPGPEPFRHLEVVPGAVCEFDVRPRALGLYRVHRRTLYNHLVIVAALDRRVASFYLWHVVLRGLVPRRGTGEPLAARLARSAIKWAHLAWGSAVAVSIVCRGWAGRPVRTIPWE